MNASAFLSCEEGNQVSNAQPEDVPRPTHPDLFYRHVRLLGGPAPVRRYLPALIELVLNGTINPGKVFDLTLPLASVADGYRAMDQRRAIKTLLLP